MTTKDRQKKYRNKQKESGKIRIEFWVYPRLKPIVKDFVKHLATVYEKLNYRG